MPSPNNSKQRVGVLLVHGIGDQKPGDFLSQFVSGLRIIFGNDGVKEIIRKNPVNRLHEIHAAQIELDDRIIFFYEVYWAELITDALAKSCFDPAQLFVVAWLPWFNKIMDLPGFEAYGRNRILWSTCRLVPLSIMFFLGYIALRAMPHLWWAFDSLERMIRTTDEAFGSKSKSAEGRRRMARTLGIRVGRRRLATPNLDILILEQRGWLDVLLEKYAGDVVNYVASVSGLPNIRDDMKSMQRGLRELLVREQDPSKAAKLQTLLQAEEQRQIQLAELADQILGRFESVAWIAAEEDHCTELQILGHSLGSVIAYHAIGLGRSLTVRRPLPTVVEPSSSVATLRYFHTIGSPLEKIHFFWPSLASTPQKSPQIHAMGPNGTIRIHAESDFRWHNYYSVSDGISGALTHYDSWGEVTNVRIPGLGGVLTAHVGYQNNIAFLTALCEALGVKRSITPGTVSHRMAAWMWSAFQSAGLLVFVSAICFLGLAVVVGFWVFGAGVLAALVFGFVKLVHSINPLWGLNWNIMRLLLWLSGFFGMALTTSLFVFTPLWGRRVAHAAVMRYRRGLRMGGPAKHSE